MQKGISTERIVTLEDPVETRDEDVLQVQVNEKAGVTYSAWFKSDFKT